MKQLFVLMSRQLLTGVVQHCCLFSISPCGKRKHVNGGTDFDTTFAGGFHLFNLGLYRFPFSSYCLLCQWGSFCSAV